MVVVEKQEILRRAASSVPSSLALDMARGAGALADRDYVAAELHYGQAYRRTRSPEALKMLILALGLAGNRDQALARLAELEALGSSDPQLERYRRFVSSACGLGSG